MTENLNEITAFFARIWDVFTLQHPLLGIPFSVIYLGVFAIGFSIAILKPILGIGGGIVDNISASAKSARRSANARSRAKYNASYESYAKNRAREEAYAKRYERR